jgi:hypothetical protein
VFEDHGAPANEKRERRASKEIVMPITFVFGFLAAIALAVLAALRFSRIQTIVIRPPQLNHSDGFDNVTSPDAAASRVSDRQTGECLAGAEVDGVGRASSRSAIGHEFQYTGTRRQNFRVSVVFEYRTLETVGAEPARATGIVNVVLAPNSPNFANDIQTVAGRLQNPAGGGFTQETVELQITLDPNDSFIVDVELTAIAEATDAARPAACRAEVTARLLQIILAPLP